MQVSIDRGSDAKTKFRVASKYKKLVMSTRYRKSPYTARVMLKSLRMPTLVQVNRSVRQEIKRICSRKSGDSVLRLSSILAVTNFSWGPVMKELKLQAPTMYSLINSALSSRKCKAKKSAVGVNASILLKTRNKDIALFQAVVSVVMYAGHCSKQVSY